MESHKCTSSYQNMSICPHGCIVMMFGMILIGSKKSPEVGIEPGTFGFISVIPFSGHVANLDQIDFVSLI